MPGPCRGGAPVKFRMFRPSPTKPATAQKPFHPAGIFHAYHASQMRPKTHGKALAQLTKVPQVPGRTLSQSLTPISNVATATMTAVLTNASSTKRSLQTARDDAPATSREPVGLRRDPPRIRGYVSQLLVREIHVGLDLADQLEPLRHDQSPWSKADPFKEPEKFQSRYVVTLKVGRRYEPWIDQIRQLMPGSGGKSSPDSPEVSGRVSDDVPKSTFPSRRNLYSRTVRSDCIRSRRRILHRLCRRPLA